MTQPDVDVSEKVDAPLDAVWESWADFGGIYKFHSDVLRTTILTGSNSRGVGAVRRCELSDHRNDIEERIVAWEPKRLIGFEFKRTSLPIATAWGDFSFESCSASQTQVRMRFWFTPLGLVPRLMKPVMTWKIRSGFEKLLANNKNFVEQGTHWLEHEKGRDSA